MKICNICKKEKGLEDFNKDRCKKDGYMNFCKECRNRKHLLNKEKNNKKSKEKKKGDILFKLICRLRSRLSKSVRENKLVKKSKTIDILGISIHEFKLYIESKFTDGMSWENYGDWHLDHIEPISYANNEEEVYKLSHYTNFQPLMAFDNLSKGNRYIG